MASRELTLDQLLATVMSRVHRPLRSDRPTVSSVSRHRVSDVVWVEVYWLVTGPGCGPAASVYALDDEVLRLDCLGETGHFHVNMKQSSLVRGGGGARIFLRDKHVDAQIEEAAFWLRHNFAYCLSVNFDPRIRGLRVDPDALDQAASFLETEMRALERSRPDRPSFPLER